MCMAMGVLALDSPAAGTATDLKDATATIAAEVVWDADDLKPAGLTKLGAHGARTLTFTTGGGTPANAPASVTITGKDIDGTALTETLALSQSAGVVESVKCYQDDGLTLTFPAADGTDATIAVGIGDTFGLPCKAKVRNGLMAIFDEQVAGASLLAGAVHEGFAIPVAPATAVGTIDEGAASASASTQPGHPVTLDVAFAAGWEGGNITVTGVGPSGRAVSETYTASPGSTVTGSKAFATVDASGIVNSAPSSTGDAATVQTGASLGLATEGVPTFIMLTVNGVAEAFAATDPANATFQPTTARDGTKTFEVWYSIAAPAMSTPATSGPYGAYTPPKTPDGSTSYLLVFEQDPQP
jgi:hypothetical protein